jgi:hypothetical protein
MVKALREKGAGGAICFASGFLETGGYDDDGERLQRELVEAAGDMPIIGPNCYGLINYADGALLWPDQHGGRRLADGERGVAILTQSSNIAISMTMQRRGLPLAFLLTAGNQAQTGLSDLACAVLEDPRVRVIPTDGRNYILATPKYYDVITAEPSNPWIAGILLAAVLAAIMSTIDSQLLVSSSALTEDFYRMFLRRNASEKELVWVGRLAVLGIAIIALILAWNEESTILELVAYAWAGFGAAFGPAVLFSLFWKRTTGLGVLLGMIVGGFTVILWQYTGSDLYEIVPGFLFSSVTIIIVSLLGKQPSDKVQQQFMEAQKPLADE